MEFEFQKLMGCSLHEYVLYALPKQEQIGNERRSRAVNVAVSRFIRLLRDALPAGYVFDGQNIRAESENDCCPIGYPSKDGMIDMAAVIDNIDFKLVLSAYKKIR